MAELVDALVSGTSIRKDVQVRVLFWALLSREARGERREAEKPPLLTEATLYTHLHRQNDANSTPTFLFHEIG